jgi:hypothetical protein
MYSLPVLSHGIRWIQSCQSIRTAHPRDCQPAEARLKSLAELGPSVEVGQRPILCAVFVVRVNSRLNSILTARAGPGTDWHHGQLRPSATPLPVRNLASRFLHSEIFEQKFAVPRRKHMSATQASHGRSRGSGGVFNRTTLDSHWGQTNVEIGASVMLKD